MQASNGWIVTLLIITIAVSIAGFLLIYQNVPDPVEIPTIPTAEEIASLVPVPVVDTSLNDEIWEGVYRRRIRRLENAAVDVCADEFDQDDIEDLFDKFVDVEFVEEFEDEREFDIIDLGLDDEDDRHIIIDGVTKWRIDDDYNEIVYGTCVVTSDDGDLEADLSYSL